LAIVVSLRGKLLCKNNLRPEPRWPPSILGGRPLHTPRPGTRSLELQDGLTVGDIFLVRVVTTPKRSALFDRILEIEADMRRFKKRFVLSWSVDRTYTPNELASADLLRVLILASFEPPGEGFGVQYYPDVDGPAEFTNRVGPLVVDCSRLHGPSLCQSIAGERLVAPGLQTLISQADFSGITVRGWSARMAGRMTPPGPS
jgi:hypothetical protein